ncbi:secretory subunit [Saxophila tyrrhenica]|uniref:Secretory subunit n=1 Tax=Saxophila tyrrhenica TaxID=1690608 RepID=A0AAV9PLE7_9PEZI|nr:secretory subunit [Saxophila tyrrhenica]
MASPTPDELPLPTLYLQIEYAAPPFAVLDIDPNSTEPRVREAYHALALRIHPDKAPTFSLRELHTSLFQKVQSAYGELLKTHFGRSEGEHSAASKRLPETLASLQARNIAFREALRSERERALKMKQADDEREAVKKAGLKAKKERLAGKREARVKAVELARVKREKEIARECRSQGKVQPHHPLAKGDEPSKGSPTPKSEPLADWEQEEDRLEAEVEKEKGAEQNDDGVASKPAKPPSPAKPKRPLQNQPTSRTARTAWQDSIDERLVPDAEITNRWNKSLLSGGRGGSVSLSQKKQKALSGAARMHKHSMALREDADGIVKPALTGNRTFSALVEEAMMEEAFVGAEARAEARTERVVRRLMDGDVVGEYLLEAGDKEWSAALGAFWAIEECLAHREAVVVLFDAERVVDEGEHAGCLSDVFTSSGHFCKPSNELVESCRSVRLE